MLRPSNRGFTLIEMMIIAPIVILAIGAFIAIIVNMTGEVLSSRGANVLAYDIQDALNRIEQDVKLSTTFLPENSIAFSESNPQGFGSHGSTTNFTNVGGASGSSLILATIASNGNPLVEGTGNIYLKNTPNDCSSPYLYKNNRPLIINIIYFIDDKGDGDPTNDTLWRRTVMPTSYTSTSDLCGGTPWQLPSCQPGYESSFCKTNDQKILEGVSVNDFEILYFSSMDAVSPNVTASDQGATTEQRRVALQATQNVSISLRSSKKIAGRDITRTGSVRVARLDANATSIADIIVPSVAGKTPSVSANVVDGSDIIAEWGRVEGASSYRIEYQVNGGAWVIGAASLGASERSFKIETANHGDAVNIRVQARNDSSQTSNWGTGSLTIPVWAPIPLRDNWTEYGGLYSPPSYTRTSSGMVMLRGLVKRPAGTGLIIGTLPEKYRPSGRLVFGTIRSVNVSGRVDILPDGRIEATDGSPDWTSIDSVRYMPDGMYTRSLPTLLSGYSNYAAPYSPMSYLQDNVGRVHIQGLMNIGTNTSGATLFTMPAGLYPPQFTHITARSSVFNTAGIYNSNGNVVTYGNGYSGYLSINTDYLPASYSGWNTLTLSAGWSQYPPDSVTYSSHQYTKTADGVVHLKGLIKGGSVATGTIITTLPPNCRPEYRGIFFGTSLYNLYRIDIENNGNVIINGGSPSSTWLSLDNIRFLASNKSGAC